MSFLRRIPADTRCVGRALCLQLRAFGETQKRLAAEKEVNWSTESTLKSSVVPAQRTRPAARSDPVRCVL